MADNTVVAGMHSKQHCRLIVDRSFVIAYPRDIGGAHFGERCSAGSHDFGDAEAAADFDKLATGDDDLFPRCQCPQHNYRGGGIIIDGSR